MKPIIKATSPVLVTIFGNRFFRSFQFRPEFAMLRYPSVRSPAGCRVCSQSKQRYHFERAAHIRTLYAYIPSNSEFFSVKKVPCGLFGDFYHCEPLTWQIRRSDAYPSVGRLWIFSIEEFTRHCFPYGRHFCPTVFGHELKSDLAEDYRENLAFLVFFFVALPFVSTLTLCRRFITFLF